MSGFRHCFGSLSALLGFLVLAPALMGCGTSGSADRHRTGGIVSMAPHLTETLFRLGVGEQVTAVSSFCDHPPMVRELPRAGGYTDPDLEKITLLKPSLLVLPGASPELTRFAELNGIRVLNIHMDSFASIDAGIAELGASLNCVKRADALRAEIRADAEALRKKVEGLRRPRVLIITTRQPGDLNQLNTVGAPSFVSEIVTLAGGENIYGHEQTAYIEASKETIVASAPEVILEFHAGESLTMTQQDAYYADWRPLSTLPAVKSGRIHLLTDSHTLRPGPRVVEVARQIAGLLHPEVNAPT